MGHGACVLAWVALLAAVGLVGSWLAQPDSGPLFGLAAFAAGAAVGVLALRPLLVRVRREAALSALSKPRSGREDLSA